MALSTFEDLEVWKRACRIAVDVYGYLRECRDFNLRDQMTRSAISIASNIAEGTERDSRLDFRRFLNIAKGSAAELRTQAYIADRTGVLPSQEMQKLIADLRELSAMLHGLSKSLNTEH